MLMKKSLFKEKLLFVMLLIACPISNGSAGQEDKSHSQTTKILENIERGQENILKVLDFMKNDLQESLSQQAIMFHYLKERFPRNQKIISIRATIIERNYLSFDRNKLVSQLLEQIKQRDIMTKELLSSPDHLKPEYMKLILNINSNISELNETIDRKNKIINQLHNWISENASGL